MVRDSAVRKDTVMVPAGGYVVIRFKTTNPGGASVGFDRFRIKCVVNEIQNLSYIKMPLSRMIKIIFIIMIILST